MDGLVLHGLHGDSTVQRQRAGDDAAGNTALCDLLGGHGGGHLLGDVLHGRQNGYLRALNAQGVGHRQRVLHDANLGIHVGGNIDGGVGDHDEPALVLENAALAHQALAAGGDQAGLAVQDSTGKVGGLQNTLHGDVGLSFPHQLHRQLGGIQLLAVEVYDLVVLLALAHLVEHGDDLILLAYQRAFHHTLAVGVDHGTQCRLVMGVSQGDALLHAAAQHILFQFLKRRKHIPFLRTPRRSAWFDALIIPPVPGKNNHFSPKIRP